MAKNFLTMFDSEVNAPIAITEHGKRKTISKGAATVKLFVNMALAGNLKALPIFLNEMRRRDARLNDRKAESASLPPQLTSEEAEKIYREMLKNARPSE